MNQVMIGRSDHRTGVDPVPKPLVSVVVPVYNGERYLALALQSIFEQDYYPLEVVVVDDGSVDDSADIVRAFKEVRYICQANQGVSVARNTGIAASLGEFIAFLDQDDVWTPNKLSVQIGYHLKHPEVGYTIARQQFFLEPGTSLPPWLKEDFLLKDQIGFLPGTLVVCKVVFEQIGDFDAAYRIASDSDWFARAKDSGIPMAILPEILLHRRIHSQNLSAQTGQIHSELLRAVKASIDRKSKLAGGFDERRSA
jgi:glycosyltransferase involved in cell wall biosynthesis